jgi:hypothetical protein
MELPNGNSGCSPEQKRTKYRRFRDPTVGAVIDGINDH